MPISSVHPYLQERLPQYQRCRDTMSGNDQIKAAGEKYLPRLDSQSFANYEKYKQRGVFFSVVSRALSGLVGLASRRSPVITHVPELEKYFSDTSNSGMAFNEVFLEMLSETLLIGRMFSLIDFPSTGGDPYIVTIPAENVINWEFSEDNILQWAVIEEKCAEFDPKDPFKRIAITKYKLLSLENGEYNVSVFNAKFKLLSKIIPTVRGAPLAFIPAIFISPVGLNSLTLVKPPMLDIADLNVAYYAVYTDYLHSLHRTASPTLVITGATDSDNITVGADSAIILPDPASRAFYLEYNGSGLQPTEMALSMLMNQMAMFSSRLSSDSGKGSESAISVQLRYSSESATLSAVVNAVQAAVTQLYNWIALFNGVEAPSIVLHKEFLNTKLTANEIAQVTQAYVAGAIDSESYYNILSNGEIPITQAVKNLEINRLTPVMDNSNIVP